MENAADALGMAAAVLIFIIAIASSFSLFGTAKETADSIIRMRDKQAYLESADLEDVFYSTSSSVKSDGTRFTDKGDRVVSIADVISTVSRYSTEKYGVTIMNQNGEILRRFDSNTEQLMMQYSNIDKNSEAYLKYIDELNNNTKTSYVTEVKFSDDTLKKVYAVTGRDNLKCGAPWYGNERQIQKRINADISGDFYESLDGQKYKGYGLMEELNGKRIVEVTNEIDQSKYVEDNGQGTNLLETYNMPTVEIVYIVY